jgi:WhiA C-terminal HTH domain/WhiA LAGLIDADG-like domain
MTNEPAHTAGSAPASFTGSGPQSTPGLASRPDGLRATTPGGRPAAAATARRRTAAGATNPDRELVAAIRAELAAIEPPRACCRIAERAGLGSAATGEAHSPVVARLAVRLAPATAADARPPADFDWETAADHCRMAWLRGQFLARGSLSLGATRTHLEFVVDPRDAPELARRLATLGLPAAVRLRRGRGVVTWKSGERVAAFLRASGAGPSLLELEARGVARTLRADLNRLLNAEAANLERAVGASARQLQAISSLHRDGRLADERDVVQAVARARLAIPEATLGELAAELGVTRSSVQRALERLERLALHPAGADAPFGPGRVAPGPG